MSKTEKAIELIRKAHTLVAEEIAACIAGNGTIGTLSQLKTVQKELEEMERKVIYDLVPPRAARGRSMGRMICDSWPLGSVLGDSVLAAEEAYVRI
jgi:hypothetical protein